MKISAILLAAISLFCTVTSLYAQPRIYGTVTKVRDGQRIEVLVNLRIPVTVRLLGLEAPADGQEMHEAVKSHLERTVLNKYVKVHITRLQDTETEGVVFENHRDINQQMLRDGAGWLIVDDLKDDATGNMATYQANQEAAKAEKRGVWAYPDLTPPSKLAAIVQASANPMQDPAVAMAAWRSLGPSVEGVFGNEIYSIEPGDCGGEIVRVIDGDTVQIKRTTGAIVSVRLAGIDAPERSQAFGMAATQLLSSMVAGQSVRCSIQKKDRYGRFVGKIELNGADVGLAMVRGCAAWHYKKYQSEQSSSDRESYSSAELAARSKKCGLWNGSAISPETYRANRFTALYRSGDIFMGGSTGAGGYSSSPTSTGGGTVQVRGYTRRDGTYVSPHTRSSPGSRRP